jgi:hypothetical protein
MRRNQADRLAGTPLASTTGFDGAHYSMGALAHALGFS